MDAALGAGDAGERILRQLIQDDELPYVAIGFLDDDFGPPPGSKRDVDYKQKHYPVTFPLAAHVIVKGDDMAPIYKWLTQAKYSKYKDTEVKWDFQKYLINEKGVLVAEFDPKVSMTTPAVVAEIEK